MAEGLFLRKYMEVLMGSGNSLGWEALVCQGYGIELTDINLKLGHQ